MARRFRRFAGAIAALTLTTSCFVAMPHGMEVTGEEVIATSSSPPRVGDNGGARLFLLAADDDRLILAAATDYDCFLRHRDTITRRGVKVNRLESLLGGPRAGFAWSLLYSASLGGLAWLAIDRDHDVTGLTLFGFAAIPWATLPWAALRARDSRFTETVVSERREGTLCARPRELVLSWNTSLSTRHPVGADGGFAVLLPPPAALAAAGFDLPAPQATLILGDGTRVAATIGFDLGATPTAAAWRKRAAAPD